MQTNRKDDKGLATTDFQENRWKEEKKKKSLCWHFRNQLCKIKGSELTGFVFFSRLHRPYDKSSCRNKRMIHLSQMNRKCHMFPSPDDYTKNIFLFQKDQIPVWLHKVVNVQITTIIPHGRCISWAYHRSIYGFTQSIVKILFQSILAYRHCWFSSLRNYIFPIHF